MLKTLEIADPGNRYGVPYLWGTTGFTYNVKMIQERMPDAPVHSGDMIFKPEVAKHFADCGITFSMSRRTSSRWRWSISATIPTVSTRRSSRKSEAMLKSVRPYIRYFSSAKMLIDLPNEEVCIAMSWSGDYAQAMYRAQEAGKPVRARLHHARARERWRGSTCGSFPRMRRIRTMRTCS